ncbi:MAG: hypothetical protein HY299_04200 [Verrucomicrobia bacterium]|nr:hypothetical protein [Verrucomicrobiota bacterium]
MAIDDSLIPMEQLNERVDEMIRKRLALIEQGVADMVDKRLLERKFFFASGQNFAPPRVPITQLRDPNEWNSRGGGSY